ncbi:MAG: glycoside hydrolase family 28 protein [Candidatus Ornithospirochaeta sp.]|nr:glycoside hydrolase family 28 protein [Candidatus Ornithospirochaeta sp.]
MKPVLLVPESGDMSKKIEFAFREYGHVILTEGVFESGPIEIPSDAVLELGENAELRFIPDFSIYKPYYTRWEGVKCYCMHPCILFDSAENSKITGKGRINGSGEAWWEYSAERRNQGNSPETELEKMFAALNPGYETQPGGGGGRNIQFLRPPLIQIKNSRNIVIEDVYITGSPFWTVHPLFSRDVTIRNVEIKNPYTAPNTDGIDVESCSGVRILDSVVDVGDDGIALKSGSGPDGIADGIPTEDVLIKRCTVKCAHGGAVIGSETAAGIFNVTVEDCRFVGTDRGIRIKTRRGRGGRIHDLVFRNIEIEDNLCPFVINMYYRSGSLDDEDFSLEKKPIDEATPEISSVLIDSCHATGSRATAGMIVGLPERPIEGLEIRNCSFAVSPDASEDKDSAGMYKGLPTPSSRGFRIRNASLKMENVEVICEGEKILIEDGVEFVE